MNPVIERLAGEARIVVDPELEIAWFENTHYSIRDLERFAALVAAHCSDLTAVMLNATPAADKATLCAAIRSAFPMPKENT